MGHNITQITGAGLGLRRPLLGALADRPDAPVDFMEVAPENWMGIGGALGRQFRAFTERYPMVLHGLSLSVGGPAPLDETFIHRLKAFMAEHQAPLYSEHLSYCSDDGHLYDLMPIPFTEEAVHHVAARIRRVQDILEQRIAIENVSYYAAPGQEMAEIDFVNAVLAEADCDLLLDVNNIYVNSINHGYDADEFLQALPGEPAYEQNHLEAQRIFAEQLPVVPLYLRLKLAATRPDMVNFIMDPTENSEFWNIEEFDIATQ